MRGVEVGINHKCGVVSTQIAPPPVTTPTLLICLIPGDDYRHRAPLITSFWYIFKLYLPNGDELNCFEHSFIKILWLSRGGVVYFLTLSLMGGRSAAPTTISYIS